MCGICGKVSFKNNVVDRSLIANMCQRLIHRGPDDEGIYTSLHVGLGQRRLSIIDLSRGAVAPLPNEDGTIWVTFNGEIYNFQELKAELIEKGHVFRTATDTEVIVHLYEEYGTQCLTKMRGMFAFALWDSNQKRLFTARDRLGKKPFFYTKTSSSLIFGSEIQAILTDPEVSVSPNFAAIDQYLTYQYVPSPLTAFAGIFKLPPAHFLTCEANGAIEIHRYWSPPLLEKTTASPDEIEAELLERLKEAVRLRLISDVPLGAFLSGGVDSASVVALMALESPKPVKTFSIGFEEEDYNELPYARLIAERYQTEHHEFTVKPAAAEILPLLVRHYGEPFADSSALPTYYVAKMTRQYVTVALSGDGGDENFSGYHHYRQLSQWAAADVIPQPARKAIASAMESILDRLPYQEATAKLSKALFMLGTQLPDRYNQQLSILKPQEKKACYTSYFKSLAKEIDTSDPLAELPWNDAMDALDWMMRHDQNFHLPDCWMVKVDIASMANSLEVRCPFIDHKLIEFTATIPSFLKRNSKGGKLILKNVMKGLLPPEILNKRKTGFGVPLAKWFRGELSDLVRAMLLDSTAQHRGLFEQRFTSKMVDEQLTGQRDWSNRLWAFLCLEMWFREFID
jgi:asparagine synthase (glutamine-hydrolysing)